MLSQWIRILHDDNGTLKDLTIAAQNSDDIVLPFVAAQDRLYIGQYFPFNNIFFEPSTPNTASSELAVRYWSDNDWRSAVEVLDSSSVAGASLNRDGSILYTMDEDFRWSRVDDTSKGEHPTELEAVRIYNLYWIEINFDNDLDVGTILKSIGYSFTTSETLSGIDPDIDKYLDSWESGKTDWVEQILLASQMVVSDLKRRGLVWSVGSIFRMDDVFFITAYRTLMIIYSGLGSSFDEKKDDAKDEYDNLIGASKFTFDLDEDGLIDIGEINFEGSRMVR